MKILGIIAEYNPFHRGHLYQIEQAKKTFGADYVIALMSGHFVQRGEPALFDPFVRAKAALLSGIDAVFEMPMPFSTASARDFAAFGIGFFDALGIDGYSFGTEGEDMESLTQIADILLHESSFFSAVLQKELKSGVSFPRARQKAILSLLPESDPKRDFAENFLHRPNTVLALEYLRAAKYLHSALTPVPVLRKGGDYHEPKLREEGSFSSATSIRRHLKETGLLPKAALPLHSLAAYEGERAVFCEDFSVVLAARLLSLQKEGRELTEYFGITPELSSRILKKSATHFDYEELIAGVKTKNYTYTALSRGLCHIALDLNKKDMAQFKEVKHPGYARLFGFQKKSLPLFSELKKRSRIPILSKLADAKDVLADDPRSLALLFSEVHAARVYGLIYAQKYKVLLPDIYRRSPVLVLPY